jgi:hypothetical protein
LKKALVANLPLLNSVCQSVISNFKKKILVISVLLAPNSLRRILILEVKVRINFFHTVQCQRLYSSRRLGGMIFFVQCQFDFAICLLFLNVLVKSQQWSTSLRFLHPTIWTESNLDLRGVERSERINL